MKRIAPALGLLTFSQLALATSEPYVIDLITKPVPNTVVNLSQPLEGISDGLAVLFRAPDGVYSVDAGDRCGFKSVASGKSQVRRRIHQSVILKPVIAKGSGESCELRICYGDVCRTVKVVNS